jgi:uncharacterized protein YbjT (DUF2867 family)
MSDKKIIAIVGATGAQGGGLAHAILSDPNSEFSVRAFTRDVNSDASKALARAGAEIISIDIDDEAAITKGLAGVYGAFFVTFFWAHFNPEIELRQAENMAKAAKASGVKHVIWSTLEDTRHWIPLTDDRMPTLQGKYKVVHFDAKADANHFFTDLGLPVTFLQTTFYWENLIYFGMGPQRGTDGQLTLTLPMGNRKLSGISASDIGQVAYSIFKGGPSNTNQFVSIAGEHLTGTEMADALSAAIGEKVIYNSITPNDYRALGFPGADDLGNMFQFYADFEDDFTKVRKISEIKKMYPGLKSFKDWLGNSARIPIAAKPKD